VKGMSARIKQRETTKGNGIRNKKPKVESEHLELAVEYPTGR